MATSLENQYISSSYDVVVQISGSNLADGTGATITNLDITASNSTSSSYSVSALSSSYSNTSTSASHAVSADTSISASHALVADSVTGTVTNATYAQNTITTGKNLAGTTIAKGTPLYFTGSGTSGNLVGIYPADAGNANRMPAGGIAGESISAGAEGIVLLDGYIGGVNTSAFNSGAKIYVAVGGGYTATPPTGSSNKVQYLGNVEKSSTNGSGVINMMGESRQLPNLQRGYAWVGAAGDLPVAVPTSSFGGGEGFPYTGSAGISGSLLVDGNTVLGGDTVIGGNEQTSIVSISGSSIMLGKPINDRAGISIVSGSGVEIYGGLFIRNNTNFAQEATATTFRANNFVGTGSYSLYALTASYALNGGGGGSTFPYTGSATISGSLVVDGNITQTDAKPADNTQIDFVSITGGLTKGTGGGPYNYINYSFANYPAYGNAYQGFLWENWDSLSYSYGADMSIGPSGFYTVLTPSGSGGSNTGQLRLRDEGNATSKLFGYATNVEIGVTDTVDLTLGGSSTNTVISGSVVKLKSNSQITGSLGVSAGITGNLTGNADTATSASYVSEAVVAKTDKNNTFTGTQTFDNIAVNGTGSFAYIESITGSAKIIGDAFIVLNNATPTERYAGIVVQDSGSGAPNTTASLEFDGQTNDWFYEYSNDGGATTDHGVVIFGPEYDTKGSPTYLTPNKLPKSSGSHHIVDSNISDNGIYIEIGSDTQITGSLGVLGQITGNVTGTLTGNADTATSASYAATANSLTTGDKTLAGYLTQNFTSPTLGNENAFVNVSGASISSKAYDRVYFGIADYSVYGAQFEDYFAIEYYDGFGYNYGSEFDINGKQVQFFTKASGSGQESYVRTTDNYDGTSQVSIGSGNKVILTGETQLTGSLGVTGGITGELTGSASTAYNNNTSSGSIGFWQGTQAEYDLISGSASDSIIYFVI